MAINNIRSLVDDCYLGGRHSVASFRKVPAIASAQGFVVDLSMAPGNPRPNYYTGDALTATLFNSAYGVWTGGNVAPATKILRAVNFVAPPTAVMPMQFYVLDYLMFYPLIDMDSTDPQEMTNTVTLPRYESGEGVRAFIVATNPYLGNANYTMDYVNHLGQNKTTRLQTSNNSTYIATLINSGTSAGISGTFINTPDGDGIRSITSITFTGPNGGLAAIVLCKVITMVTSVTQGTSTTLEWDCLLMKGELPIIKDGAYINFICQVFSSPLNQLFSGTIETVWN